MFMIAQEEMRQQLWTSAALQWCLGIYSDRHNAYIYVFLKCSLSRVVG